MGWYEEEKIANEIAWAKADIVHKLENNREALNRANSHTYSSNHKPILSDKQRGKLIITIVAIFLGIDALANIGIGIALLLHKFGIIG